MIAEAASSWQLGRQDENIIAIGPFWLLLFLPWAFWRKK